jgi:hypothetical protein
MDPSSGIWARALDGVKNWPLWLLVAVALSLTIFVAIPEFRALASPTTATALVYAAIVAWIFVLARAAKPITEAVLTYLHYREQSRYFLVTPVEGQCHWGISKQPDGSSVTQVAVHCMVKNRSAERVYIMKARIVKPRIKGEVLPGLVATRAQNANVYGTPQVSGTYIGPGQTLPVSCTLLTRGAPRRRTGPMQAKIEFEDADGHRERVKVRLTYIGQAA